MELLRDKHLANDKIPVYFHLLLEGVELAVNDEDACREPVMSQILL